ncbi:MAG: LamG domain-containing protein, partial [Eubacteriales bacterium]
IFSYSAGTQISGAFYETYDDSQGSIVFWITPEWNGDDGVQHVLYNNHQWDSGGIIIYKETNGNLRFQFGGSNKIDTNTSVSDWVAGNTYLVTTRWDLDNKIDGTNYACISINDTHNCGHTSAGTAGAPGTTSRVGESDEGDPANALIEGLTIYRRPLFDGTYGIDVGNGDEIQKINNGGSHTDSDNASTLHDSTRFWVADELIGGTVVNQTDGSSGTITDNNITTITATLSGGSENDWDTGDLYIVTGRGGVDPTLVTGSWDVVFALPTNASTGALATGEGNAWTHPHSSNLLPGNTNTGGFMLNGNMQTDGWLPEGAVGDNDSIEYNGTTTRINDNLHYNAMTVEAWVRNDNWGEGDSGATGWFIQKDDGKWRLYFNSSNGLVGYADTDSTNAMSTSGTDEFTNDGLWHHVAFTYDNDNDRTIDLYIDGAEVSSYPTHQTGTGTAVDDSAGDLIIGNNPYNTFTIDGAVGWVRISNNIRYTSGFTPPTRWSPPTGDANTVAQWNMDEGTGTSVTNDGGASSCGGTAANCNGTLTDGTWNDGGALATNQKIFAGGYKYTSNAANQGIYDEIAVTAGDDFVVRGVVNSNGTCAPAILITGADDGEITHLDGTTSSTRTDPDILLFAFEADATENIKIKLINTATSGTCYWHQVEVLENLLSNPGFDDGFQGGDPDIPDDWENQSLEAGEGAEETVTVHSGGHAFKLNTEGGTAEQDGIHYSFTGATGDFFNSGFWNYVSTGAPTKGFYAWPDNPQYNDGNYLGADLPEIAYGGAVWTHYPLIFRVRTPNPLIYYRQSYNTETLSYLDDTYIVPLTDVSLTVTPANLANSTESTGIRVDGTDTLTQDITELAVGSGTIKFNYTPRHSAADIAKFGTSTPYIATFWGDSDDYIKLYWSAANTITLSYSMGGSTGSKTYDATGDITAGTTYNFEINYIGSGDMNLSIDGTTQITLETIPATFGTTPSTAHWGTDYNGTADSSQADATFDAPDSYSDSASFYFDATTGGNHETETVNEGTSESGTVAVTENTAFNNFLMIQKSSEVLFGVGTTTASHSTQVPNSASYLRIETTDTTRNLILDHIFVRKLATTDPSAEAYGSYGDEEKSTGPIAHYTFDENKGEWAYNEVSSAFAKDPVLYLDMDDNVSGDAKTVSDASG